MNKYPTTMDDMAKLVKKGAGKEFMGLRKEISEFINIESDLLEVRAKGPAETAAKTNNVVIYGALFSVIIGIAVALSPLKSNVQVSVKSPFH